MCEPFECVEILDRERKRLQFEHELQYVAITNALGNTMSKGYKYMDMFKEDNIKEVDEDERQKMKEYLENW